MNDGFVDAPVCQDQKYFDVRYDSYESWYWLIYWLY